MDQSEKLAEKCLKNMGYSNIIYEPDGNVPPDFLVEGRYAVEVRRLNQNYDDGSGSGPRGLEEDAIPLWHRIRSHLANLGPAPATGESWYVFFSFSRPTPAWNDLKRELDALLIPFMREANPQPFERMLPLHSEFRLKVFRAVTPKSTFFELGGQSDEQSGGWLLNEIESNLSHCIKEKSTKIQRFRHKYPEWWLMLPDHIGFSLSDFERELFLDEIKVIPEQFDKVILIDPRDATRYFVVHG